MTLDQTSDWCEFDKPRDHKLRLTPGKHTVRVRVVGGSGYAGYALAAPRLEVFSNPLEIEITEGETSSEQREEAPSSNSQAASNNAVRTNPQSGVSVTTSTVTNVTPLERTVTLNAQQMPLKDVFAEVCRQVNLKLDLDTAGLEKDNVPPDSPVSLSFTNEPLTYAIIGILRRFQDRMLVWELRGETLHVSSLLSNQARTGSLPDWLKPLQGRGAHAEVDAAGNVISLYAGEIANDEFLANARTLPKLRELRIEGVMNITPEGLAHLAELQSLEKLQLWASSPGGDPGWGDDALRFVSRINTLRDLTISAMRCH